MSNKRKNDRIWITWERQRRNSSLSTELGIPLFEILNNSQFRLVRYSYSIFQTLKVIKRNKPQIVFVQNPSIVLSVLSIFLGKMTHLKIVVDAHNGGLFPLENSTIFLQRVADYITKSADLTIVTNNHLAQHVEQKGGIPQVLPDPIPSFQFKHQQIKNGSNELSVLFICTWSDDEPYLEVLDAARMIDQTTKITITGNWKKVLHKLPDSLPENVKLSGFVDENEYIELLNSTDFTMVLTTRNHCMVCGAYESVGANKPSILSNSDVLKNYFNKGTIFTDNTASSIAHSISLARSQKADLEKQVIDLKETINSQWLDFKQELIAKVENM